MRKRPKCKIISSDNYLKLHNGRYLKWGKRIFLAGALLCAFQLVKVFYDSEPELDTFSEETETEPVYRRRTLKSANDSQSDDDEGGAPWEKCDFEKSTSPFVFLAPYIALILLLFVAIAIICDDFFVPSLEAISERLNLSEDVAGATFMAAGSSAPELFTSVAGVSTESDVGVGTIVGSAMFNILIIVALSAVLAGQILKIDWRPLFRDAFVYGLSIVLFIGFSWDGKIEWYEALILLLIYALYIVIMKFNARLMTLLGKLECRFCSHTSSVGPEETQEEQSPAALEEASSKHATEGGHTHSTLQVSSAHDMHRFVHSHRGELAGSFANRRRSLSHQHSGSHLHHHHHHHHHGNHTVHHHGDHSITNPEAIQEEEEESEQKSSSTLSSSNSLSGSDVSSEVEEDASMVLIPCLPAIRSVPPDLQLHLEEGKWGVVKYILRWILFAISFPFIVTFTWTIPNCSENRKLYVVIGSFTMSIFWIAVISFAMVTLVARVGCILGIGHFTMGLIVVAMGTSVPDALSSILVARDGFGDMAVSNAIGSNVFDINLGVGLPFLMRICIEGGKPFELMKKDEHEKYDLAPHPKFGFLLLLILAVTIVTFAVFRFRLNSITGLCFVIIYALFLAYAFVQETICDHGLKC